MHYLILRPRKLLDAANGAPVILNASQEGTMAVSNDGRSLNSKLDNRIAQVIGVLVEGKDGLGFVVNSNEIGALFNKRFERPYD
jgi:hypothetical protein